MVTQLMLRASRVCEFNGQTGQSAWCYTRVLASMASYAHRIPCEGPLTIRQCRDNDNTIGMLGRTSVKYPFDGRNPQFREWSGKVKAYLTIRTMHIEDYMDESA
eukprot:4928125-Amphidinium_carterae.1